MTEWQCDTLENMSAQLWILFSFVNTICNCYNHSGLNHLFFCVCVCKIATHCEDIVSKKSNPINTEWFFPAWIMMLLPAGPLIEMDFTKKTKPSLVCQIPRILHVIPNPVIRRTVSHYLSKTAWEPCLLAFNIIWKYFEQTNVIQEH